MFESYLIYNFILVGATLAAYLYEKEKFNSHKDIYLTISFLIPFIFLALRYDIGQDYPSYVSLFNLVADGRVILKEPGYVLVNYIVAYLGLDVQWVFISFGFFTLLLVYKALPRDGFAFSIFLIMLLFYLYGYSNIRQAFVMALMLYAMRYIYEKNIWKYFLYALIGSMFHFGTAIVLFAAYFIANKELNKYLLVFLIALAFILVQYLNVATLVFEYSISIFPQYAWYLDKFSGESGSLGMFRPLIVSAIGITVILFKDKVIGKFPMANISINLYFFYIIGSVLHAKVTILGRVETMFMLYFILSIVFFIKTFNKESRAIVMLGIGIFYYLLFTRYLSVATKDIDNGLHVMPYQTIFTRKQGLSL